MEDIYYIILSKLKIEELIKIESVCNMFLKIINELVAVKIRMKGFLNYLKTTTIFPSIVKLKRINVFTKKYKNREEEPILLFNLEI
jgi:hypothetical protein|tara:strand:+ start:1344 stop:1601 length:258 start_codon:yes stop_codon:yes gene_type:complete